MKFIPQRHYDDCALSCLLMIIGSKSSYQALSFLINKGKSIADIQAILRLFSCPCEAYFSCDKKLEGESNLFIVHLKTMSGYHFAVLKKVDDIYLIYNPSAFKKTYKDDRWLNKHWTGYYLEIKQESSIEKDNFYIPYFVRSFLRIFFLLIGVLILFLFLKENVL